MDDPEDESSFDELIDTLCAGCDLPRRVNDLGLCATCFAKLERDLLRARDWAYSMTAFTVAPDQLEALRERVIRDYGAEYELIESPDAAQTLKRKNKRSKSRASQRRRDIAAHAIRVYTRDDVLRAAQNFIRAQTEAWVNFSRVSQHLYETFDQLKPKHLGQPGKKYKSLLKFVMDNPADFELRQDPEHRGLYWIRLKMS